jgi:hypothetical protein
MPYVGIITGGLLLLGGLWLSLTLLLISGDWWNAAWGIACAVTGFVILFLTNHFAKEK